MSMTMAYFVGMRSALRLWPALAIELIMLSAARELRVRAL